MHCASPQRPTDSDALLMKVLRKVCCRFHITWIFIARYNLQNIRVCNRQWSGTISTDDIVTLSKVLHGNKLRKTLTLR